MNQDVGKVGCVLFANITVIISCAASLLRTTDFIGNNKNISRLVLKQLKRFIYIGQWPKTGAPGAFLAKNGCTKIQGWHRVFLVIYDWSAPIFTRFWPKARPSDCVPFYFAHSASTRIWSYYVILCSLPVGYSNRPAWTRRINILSDIITTVYYCTVPSYIMYHNPKTVSLHGD